jgi:hypothetical protein
MDRASQTANVEVARRKASEQATPNLWVVRRELDWAALDRVWAVAWSRDLSCEELLAKQADLRKTRSSTARAATRCYHAELRYDGQLIWRCELGDDDCASHAFAPHWGGHLEPARFSFCYRRSSAVPALRPKLVKAAVLIDARPSSCIEGLAASAFGPLGARAEGSPAIELVALRRALLAASAHRRTY